MNLGFEFDGKESQRAVGLDYLDYGARMYDPELGRWFSQDPQAEEYYGTSPFVYTANNPALFIDPNGEEIQFYEIARYNGVSFGGWSIDNSMTQTIGGFEVSPYMDENGSIMGWSASRGGRIMFMMDDPVDIEQFTEMESSFRAAGDLFYMNGTPSQGMIEMLAGDVGKGLTEQWKGAATDPGYYMYLANLAGAVVVNLGNRSTNVYRVYGGDSHAKGWSWTPTNPNSVSNYRNVAGLPSGRESGMINTGRFVIEGTVQQKNIINTHPAQALDGNIGGLPEYVVDPTKVQINRISGANPKF